MTTAYTSLLGLALPVTGELQGTWGDTVNDAITSLLDTAVAGTTTLSSDADVTLTTTTGAANQARQQIILWTASGSVTRNITAPAQSKTYVVINATGGSQSIVLRGVGPTTGVTILAGEKAVVAWNGSDFVKVSTFGGSPSFTNVTVTGTTTLSGLTASTALALNASKEVVSVTNTGTGNNVLATSPTLTTPNLGTPSAVTLTNATGLPLSTGVTGTLATTNGGTGLTSFTSGGVVYASSTSALTTGSALTFDGANLLLSTGYVSTATGQFTAGATGANSVFLEGSQHIFRRGSAGSYQTQYTIDPSGNSIWSPGGTEQMRLTSTGLGIGTSSPTQKLTVSGAAAFSNFGINSTPINTVTTAQSFARFLTTGGDFYLGTESSTGGSFFPGSTAYAAVLYNSASTPMQFYTAGALRATLDSSGNLGIGTSSITYRTEIWQDANSFTGARIRNNDAGASAYAGMIINASGNSWAMRMGSSAANSNALQLVVDALGTPTVRATLDTSGNLGLGVTPSAWSTTDSVRALQLNGGSFYVFGANRCFVGQNVYLASGGIGTYVTTAAASNYLQYQGAHSWYTAPSGTAGNAISFTQAMTLDASGNLLVGTTSSTLGRLEVVGGTGIRVNEDAAGTKVIQVRSAFAGGDPAINVSTNHALAFNTNNTERARITSGGDLLVGQTGFISSERFGVTNTGATQAAAFKNDAAATDNIVSWNAAASGDNQFIGFYTDAGSSYRGGITYNRAGGLVAYNTTSDYRAKDILGPVASPGATIDALKVYEGQMKGATQPRPMLVAHEAQEHAPYAVSGVKDAVNEDGTPKFQQMDVSSLVPLLIAEIQSLRARVAALEA